MKNCHTYFIVILSPKIFKVSKFPNSDKGSFTNYVNKTLAFFDHLPTYVDIFYGMNVDKKWALLDHLPNVICERPLI